VEQVLKDLETDIYTQMVKSKTKSAKIELIKKDKFWPLVSSKYGVKL
jgi:hypothetical protein